MVWFLVVGLFENLKRAVATLILRVSCFFCFAWIRYLLSLCRSTPLCPHVESTGEPRHHRRDTVECNRADEVRLHLVVSQLASRTELRRVSYAAMNQQLRRDILLLFRISVSATSTSSTRSLDRVQSSKSQAGVAFGPEDVRLSRGLTAGLATRSQNVTDTAPECTNHCGS